MMLLSIIVPTYKERETIERALSRIRSAVRGESFEVIVVDDDSPDQTWRIAAEFGTPDVVVIRRIGIKGLATAVVDGFRFAEGDYVAVMDADLQHPPEYLPELLSAARSHNCDLVIGSRYMPGGGVEGWSRLRLLVSRGASVLSWIMLPETRGISDPMSGFFLLKRQALEGCLDNLRPRGYKILLEVLVRCKPGKVLEVPYIFRRRLGGKSKLGAKTVIDYVIHVLELSGWRPLKFALVGASGVLVNLAVYNFFINLTSGSHWFSSLMGAELSTIYNFVLHDLWTFRDRRSGSAWSRMLLFHLAVLPAIITQYAVSNFLFYVAHMPGLLAQLIGIALGFIVNYVLSEIGVWRQRS